MLSGYLLHVPLHGHTEIRNLNAQIQTAPVDLNNVQKYIVNFDIEMRYALGMHLLKSCNKLAEEVPCPLFVTFHDVRLLVD
jgi:hypothetical protein